MHEAESAKGSHQLLLRTVTLSFQIFDGSCRQALLLGAQRQPLIPTHAIGAPSLLSASTRGAGSTQPTHCTSPAAHRLALCISPKFGHQCSSFWWRILSPSLSELLVPFFAPFPRKASQAEVIGGKASSQVSASPHPQYRIVLQNAPRTRLGESRSRRLVGNRRR